MLGKWIGLCCRLNVEFVLWIWWYSDRNDDIRTHDWSGFEIGGHLSRCSTYNHSRTDSDSCRSSGDLSRRFSRPRDTVMRRLSFLHSLVAAAIQVHDIARIALEVCRSRAVTTIRSRLSSYRNRYGNVNIDNRWSYQFNSGERHRFLFHPPGFFYSSVPS